VQKYCRKEVQVSASGAKQVFEALQTPIETSVEGTRMEAPQAATGWGFARSIPFPADLGVWDGTTNASDFSCVLLAISSGVELIRSDVET